MIQRNQESTFSVWDSTLVCCEDERRNLSKRSENFYQTIRYHITRAVILIDAVVCNSGPPCNYVFNIRPETPECFNEGPTLRAAGYILQKTQEQLECQFVRLRTTSQFTPLSLQIIKLGVSDYNLHSVPYNNATTFFPKPICSLPNNMPLFPLAALCISTVTAFVLVITTTNIKPVFLYKHNK